MDDNEAIKPHTAVISVQLEVHSLLETGECSGRVVSKDVLNEYNINGAFLTTISGSTREDCLKKLQTKMEALNEHDG